MTTLVRNWISEWIIGLGRIAVLCWEIVGSIFRWKMPGRDLVYEIYFIGVKSQSVVLITGAFTGMVLCVQAYLQFHKIKMDTGALAVVSVSMASELGPVLTALMVAGRVGAAIAAELGTMRVTEQIDALRTLTAHPVDYLVVPRVLGTIIAMPLLTGESIVIGIGAGYLVGVYYLGIDAAYLWHNMYHYTDAHDIIMGYTKAIIFGAIIGTIGCYKGLTCPQGAEGVGRATTEAVVYASITILISNFFLTLVLNRLLQPQ